jgi:hypothetical protein
MIDMMHPIFATDGIQPKIAILGLAAEKRHHKSASQ